MRHRFRDFQRDSVVETATSVTTSRVHRVMSLDTVIGSVDVLIKASLSTNLRGDLAKSLDNKEQRLLNNANDVKKLSEKQKFENTESLKINNLSRH